MRKNSKLRRQWEQQRWGYLFIAPQMILFAMFLIYPMVEGVRLSLYKTRYLNAIWCGLNNYVKLFGDEVFLKGVFNTVVIVLAGTALTMFSGILISVSVFDKRRGYVSFVRCSYYLPTIVSAVVMCIVWSWFLNPSLGVLPYFLRQWGFGDVNLLGNKATAMPFLIFIVWQLNIGQTVVMLLAQMQGLSNDVLEAAGIDGATRFQKIIHVILPLSHQTINYLTILNTISIIKVYIVIDMLTGGGPNYATTTLMYLSYNEAFNYNHLGNGAAIGVIMFLIVLLLSLTQLSRLRKMAQ